MKSSSSIAAPHIILGKYGEEKAANFLIKNHYSILARNWHIKKLELDIICEKNKEIFFIEVKTRKHNYYDKGFGSITQKKIINIIKAAQYWLDSTGMSLRPCHFDVICLYGYPPNLLLTHYKDAFDLPNLMDSSNSYW